RFGGFITGNGSLRIDATREQPLEIAGAPCNSFKGTTTLVRGVLKLGKPAGAVAIPGHLVLGGSDAANNGDAVLSEADGQLTASAVVSLEGSQPSYLDLNGHQAAFGKLMLSKPAAVRTGRGGALRVRQLFVDGKRLKDGVYRIPQAWLEGTGTV